MRTLDHSMKFAAAALLALGAFTGCETTGSNDADVYYNNSGAYDLWYYGNYYDDGDIIVTPPVRPDPPVHAEQPIYHPSPPRPTPMPSIPSMPRVSPRGGGGRR